LYNISRHIMFILFPPGMTTPPSLTFQGSIHDGTSMSMEIPVSSVISSDIDQPMIHTMAARSILGELEEGRLAIQAQNSVDLADAVKEEGIRVGVAHNLANRWTAFVAVDEENESVVTDDFSKEPQRDVPRPSFSTSLLVGSPLVAPPFPLDPATSPSAGGFNNSAYSALTRRSAHHAVTPFGAVQSPPPSSDAILTFLALLVQQPFHPKSQGILVCLRARAFPLRRLRLGSLEHPPSSTVLRTISASSAPCYSIS
jgi:hypothetical protein